MYREVAIVDWGTSSFRLWLISPQGTVLDSFFGTSGMSTLKPNQFPTVLEKALAEVGAAPNTPVVICGMAGAAQGWVEVPYIDIPASPETLAGQAFRVNYPHRPVFILPGLAQRFANLPDVMRGEETLLLGAILSDGVEGLVCLPGTHSKWAVVDGGRITAFETAMTGEVFALLFGKSILAHFLGSETAGIADVPAFSDGVNEALAQPERVLQSLFSLRAAPLLKVDVLAKDLTARLSGLLIGLEIAGSAVARDTKITLISRGEMAEAYKIALDIAGAKTTSLDSEKMVRVGLLSCARNILDEVRAKTPVPA